MMKKITLALMIAVMLLTPVVLAKNEKQTEPLDKITFIHYKDGTVKIVGKEANSPVCYKLMGVQWKALPVSYVVNPGSYDSNFVTGAISAATKTWDDATSKHLFNGYIIDSSATWDDSASQVDYKNEYVFGSYPDTNVIAITNIWYTRYGKQIVDYDVLFNTYYKWKDCSVPGSCPAAMDLQNIATHETGHGLGLSDIYSKSCTAVTMYGYSSYGETIKRTLEPADITGLQKIYGT
jgi:hypothetical protein